MQKKNGKKLRVPYGNLFGEPLPSARQVFGRVFLRMDGTLLLM